MCGFKVIIIVFIFICKGVKWFLDFFLIIVVWKINNGDIYFDENYKFKLNICILFCIN